MAFSGNNQSIFNSALNGCLAGMLAGGQVVDPTAADFASMVAIAVAFATEVDAKIATDAAMSTGAAGTTIDPVAGATQATFIAKPNLAFALCFGYWFGRPFAPGVTATAAGYVVGATSIAAIYAEATGAAGYGAAPGGSSLT
jgi:hypothetical protein